MSLRARICICLFLLGLVATSSLLLLPVERAAPQDLASMPPLLLRVLSALQPLLLVMVAVAVGCSLARKVGLGVPLLAAVLAGGAVGPAIRGLALPTLLVALGTAAIIVVYGVASAPWLGDEPVLAAPLATRLLYGGIGEELMLRWGVMTLLIWIGWRLTGRPEPVPVALVWTGILIAGLLFALGHLPLLYALIASPPPALLAMVLIGNGLPGIGFGWLFWRHGLEAAMFAHALAHLFAWAAAPVFG